MNTNRAISYVCRALVLQLMVNSGGCRISQRGHQPQGSANLFSGGSRISPRWGCQLSEEGGAPTYDFAKFSQKLHEIERIWTPGRRASIALLVRSATAIIRFIWFIFLKLHENEDRKGEKARVKNFTM